MTEEYDSEDIQNIADDMKNMELRFAASAEKSHTLILAAMYDLNVEMTKTIESLRSEIKDIGKKKPGVKALFDGSPPDSGR